MDVVVDTNVFLKALFDDDDWCLRILAEEAKGIFKFVFNLETAAELFVMLTETFTRKQADKHFKYKIISKFLKIFCRSKIIEQKTYCSLCNSDPGDNKFLSCAIDSRAPYLITCNNIHLNEDLEPLVKKQYGHTVKIVSPYQMMMILLQKRFARYI